MSITTTQVIAREDDDTFGWLIEPGGLIWDLDEHKINVFQTVSYEIADMLGRVEMIWREGNDIVAGITWIDGRFDEDLCANTTIMANQVTTDGSIKDGDIRVTSGVLREVFLAGNLPWGNGVMDVAYPGFPKEVVEKIDSKES